MKQTHSSPFADGLGPALLYMGFRAAAWLAEHLPLAVTDGLVRIGSLTFHRFSKKKKPIVRNNLRRALGTTEGLDEAVKGAFLSYGEYWVETFRLGRYSSDDLLSMVHIDERGVADLEDAYREGRGVVLATCHVGFYDLGVAWIGTKGWPFTTVAEVLRPRALFEWFAAIRGRRGMQVIPAKPGDVARERLLSLLKAGEAVAILSDRDLGRRGIWAEFFGERTTFPYGPSLLVARSGAPLLVGGIYKQGHRSYRVDWKRVPFTPSGDEAADIEAAAQVIATGLESFIRKHPEQWHLFSTNWPGDEPHLPSRGRKEGQL